MPSNQYSKQPQQLSSAFGNFLNGGAGDSVIGGAISGVPSAIGAIQGIQDEPGDRVVIGFSDAKALSKTSIGTLYGGVYQYVQVLSTATIAPAVGLAAFWVTAGPPSPIYTVTTDESGATGVNLWAGAFLQALTKGYNGYIQIAGKATVLFTTPLTGTGAAGASVYLAADGAGRFDTFDGVGANPTFDQVQSMDSRYVGVAEAAAANNTLSVITMDQRHFRW
jgi:hypothetical protein